jgi:5S rRNA maturation endonuclease (ribonuclease M5)
MDMGESDGRPTARVEGRRKTKNARSVRSRSLGREAALRQLIAELVRRLIPSDSAQNGTKFVRVHCPLHDDENASATLNTESGFLNCFGGCDAVSPIDLADRLQLPVPEILRRARPQAASNMARSEDQYEYQRADGTVAYVRTVLRYDDGSKRAFYNGPEGEKGRGSEPLLYCMPDLEHAGTDARLVIVEGEKDVVNLRQAIREAGASERFVVTTAGAATDWRESFAEYLASKFRRAIVIPDHDKRGIASARRIRDDLCARGLWVHGVRFSEFEIAEDHGRDVSDFLMSGHSWNEIVELVCEDPDWGPEPDAGSADVGEESGVRLGQAKVCDQHLRGGLEIAYQLSPPRWFVEDYLPQGLALLFGQSNCGKSTLAIDLAMAVSLGSPWRSRIAVEKAPVVYLAAEQGASVPYRLRAWLDYHGHSQEEVIRIPFLLETAPVHFNIPSEVTRLLKRLEGLPFDPAKGILFVETLNGTLNGSENDAYDVAAHYAGVRTVLRELGMSGALITHHSGWNQQGRPRGSSALVSNAESTVRVTNAGHTMKFEHIELKAPLPSAVRFEILPVELPDLFRKDGRPVTSVVAKPLGLGELPSTIEPRQQEFFKILRDYGGQLAQKEWDSIADKTLGRHDAKTWYRYRKALQSEKLITKNKRIWAAIRF